MIVVVLFVVIRLTFNNSTGAIDLLGEDESDHLVRERHPRERNFLIGTLVQGRGEAIGAADDEYQPTG